VGNESGFVGDGVGYESSKNARVKVERPGQNEENDMEDITRSGETADTL